MDLLEKDLRECDINEASVKGSILSENNANTDDYKCTETENESVMNSEDLFVTNNSPREFDKETENKLNDDETLKCEKVETKERNSSGANLGENSHVSQENVPLKDNSAGDGSSKESIIKHITDSVDLTISTNSDGVPARVRYIKNYLTKEESDDLYASLIKDLEWQQRESVNKFTDNKYAEPRLTYWFGKAYKYSGVSWPQNNIWHPKLESLRQALSTDDKFSPDPARELNSVMCNYYRDNKDSIGWHSDDEVTLGRCPKIASISLGCTRMFDVCKREEYYNRKGQKVTDVSTFPGCTEMYRFHLNSGSLLLMEGSVQDDWVHRVPSDDQEMAGRINLTFRFIVGEEEEKKEIGRKKELARLRRIKEANNYGNREQFEVLKDGYHDNYENDRRRVNGGNRGRYNDQDRYYRQDGRHENDRYQHGGYDFGRRGPDKVWYQHDDRNAYDNRQGGNSDNLTYSRQGGDKMGYSRQGGYSDKMGYSGQGGDSDKISNNRVGDSRQGGDSDKMGYSRQGGDKMGYSRQGGDSGKIGNNRVGDSRQGGDSDKMGYSRQGGDSDKISNNRVGDSRQGVNSDKMDYSRQGGDSGKIGNNRVGDSRHLGNSGVGVNMQGGNSDMKGSSSNSGARDNVQGNTSDKMNNSRAEDNIQEDKSVKVNNNVQGNISDKLANSRANENSQGNSSDKMDNNVQGNNTDRRNRYPPHPCNYDNGYSRSDGSNTAKSGIEMSGSQQQMKERNDDISKSDCQESYNRDGYGNEVRHGRGGYNKGISTYRGGYNDRRYYDRGEHGQYYYLYDNGQGNYRGRDSNYTGASRNHYQNERGEERSRGLYKDNYNEVLKQGEYMDDRVVDVTRAPGPSNVVGYMDHNLSQSTADADQQYRSEYQKFESMRTKK